MVGTPSKLYRTLAVAEMITWTLLIIAMIVRYGFDNRVLIFPAGLIHGFVFVAYAATALVVGIHQRWSPVLTIGAIASAVVPYATVPVHRALERRGRLDGHWRLTAGDDPRDHRPVDRVLRWGLQRPLIMVGIALVCIVALVGGLLAAGPPTQWGQG